MISNNAKYFAFLFFLFLKTTCIKKVVPLNFLDCNFVDYVYSPEKKVDKFKHSKSVLLIGDSTDRNKMNALCTFLNKKPVSYIRHLHLENRHGNSGYASCSLNNKITVGQFMHYGVMDPPYFHYAYPIPPQLQNESYSHLVHDATKFRTVNNGKDPTLIILQSYAWDIATECEKKNREKSNLLLGKVDDWFTRNLRFIKHVNATFPSSRIMWRTSHPYTAYCATPSLLHKMNNIMRTLLPKYGIDIVEWNLLVTSTSTPMECKGQLHVSDTCNLPYMNVVLNVLSRVQPTDS